MTKLKNTNNDKIKKMWQLKLWQNLKNKIVTKLKSNWEKTQKLKYYKIQKNWNVTKLKNSNCDETKKNKIVAKLKNLIYDNSNSQIVTKFKNSNCDKTQNVTNVKTQIMIKIKIKLKLWRN